MEWLGHKIVVYVSILLIHELASNRQVLYNVFIL